MTYLRVNKMAWMRESLHEKEFLFKRMSSGEDKAFRELFHFYNGKLYPFVLKLTRSQPVAEDIVQEVFLKLWKHRADVAEMEYPESWLYTVASNLCFSWLRAHSAEIRRIKNMKFKSKTHKDQIINHLSAKEIELLLADLVGQLPLKRQKIYKLSREQGLSYKEIAEKMNISPNTVKNQLVTALKFIRVNIRKSIGSTFIFILLSFFH